VTLDLPGGVLETAARLAQKRNVPRAEIFALAIEAWGRMEHLEMDLAAARAEAERQSRRLTDLARDLEAARAGVARASAELAEREREVGEGAVARRALEHELGPLRAGLEAAREEMTRLRREAASAVRRAAELEELDRKKVLAVMRDGEVVKLRAHAQELVVGAQKLDKELEYSKLDGSLKAKKLDSTARQLAVSGRLRRDLEARLKRLQRDAFASERQIGVLLRDRARLREELRRLARIINRGLASAPRPASRKPRPAGTRKP
jgi:hypothetical protein